MGPAQPVAQTTRFLSGVDHPVSNLMQRLQRIEQAITPRRGPVVLAMDDGESREQCIRRHGYDPNDRGAVYLCLDELDQRI